MKLRPLFTFFVVLIASLATASQMKIKAVSMVGLILRPAVRADLKVTEDQVNRLKEIQSEMQSGLQAMMAGGGFSSQEDVQEEVTRISSEINQKALKVLTPEQLTRLKEIEYQLGSPEFFLRPSTIKALSIKPDQIEKIKALEESYMEDQAEIQQSSSTQEEKNAERDNLLVSIRKKIVALLSADQKTTLDKLSGAPLAKK
jgi:hypothetical protein